MFQMVWEGLKRLAIAAVCAGAVVLIIRTGRERDNEPPTQDDFRP